MSPSIPTMAPFLRKVEARSSFSPEERAAILGLPFTSRRIDGNRDFVRRGEQVTQSCFVFEGMVGTFGQNRNGIRQITSVFMNGDMVNLQTLVLPVAMSAIQALVTTTILQVPHSALRDACHRFPNIADAFWRECVIDASIINEWVVNVGRRDARSAMAHLFCELACRSGQATPDEAFTFNFPVTQNHLSDMLGLTSVHVNRTLKGLREDGLLDLAGRKIVIRNWETLTQIGDFDPTYLQLGRAANGHPPGQTCESAQHQIGRQATA